MAEFDYSELFKAAQQSDNLFEGFESEWGDSEDTEWTHLSVSDRQYDVITHPWRMNEILSVSAGPGSGKTFTVAARIAHMLENGMDPSEILVLSMANRSVDALRKSLGAIIGKESAAAVDISTFHSFCGLVIDQYGHMFDPSMGTRRIFDKKCWNNLAQFFLSKQISLGNVRLEGSITALRMDKLLSEVTNGALSVEDAARKYKINADYIDTLLKYLNKHGMMRYDDLVTNALELIRKSIQEDKSAPPENMVLLLMPRLASYKAVFVDEFQDMYPLITSVVKAVVTYPTTGYENCRKHLTISGDPNQSIYEFLGASRTALRDINKVLPSMDVVEKPLMESFRCTQQILDVAATMCLNSQDNQGISLKSNRETDLSVKPILLQHPSQESEFYFVADEIIRLICCLGGLIHPKDIAVLTRTNLEVEKIQTILKERYGIKSNKISLGNLWVSSPMHIYRDILSVISGQFDSSFSLLNLLPILDPARGNRLRALKVFNVSINANEKDHQSNFLEAYIYDELEKISDKKTGSSLQAMYKSYPRLLENIAEFLNQIQLEREKLQTITQENPVNYNPEQLVKCLAHIAKLPPIHEHVFEGNEKNSSFNSFLESFNNSVHHSYDGYLSRPDLHETTTFVDYFLHTYDNDVPENHEDLVQISTVHSAKGLEFPIVFVIGRSSHTSYWDSYLNTEDRSTSSHLLYVALTRARDLLYVGTGLNTAQLPTSVQTLFQCEVPYLLDKEMCNNSPETGARILDPAQDRPKLNMLPHAVGFAKLSVGDLPGGLLRSLSQDLGRPIPLLQKMAKGWQCYGQIMKSTKKDPRVRKSHVSHYMTGTRQAGVGAPRTTPIVGAVKTTKALARRL